MGTKMNVENILKVADAIEQHSIPDLGFNMAEYVAASYEGAEDMSGHSCGTVACIAGWANAVMEGGIPARRYSDFLHSDARDWMGLTRGDADTLFYAFDRPAGLYLSTIAPNHAVAVLRHLATTGKVDWTVTSPEAA